MLIPYLLDSPTTEVDNKSIMQTMEERTPECLTRDSYTVGWICALDVELAASMAMLDNELPGLPQAEGDSNTYILGRIGRHNIVLTCLPSGTTGTNAAANAATNMMRSFPNIRFCLMVGIGGGAPRVPSDDPCEDIRLGDIVVSCPSINSGKQVFCLFKSHNAYWNPRWRFAIRFWQNDERRQVRSDWSFEQAICSVE